MEKGIGEEITKRAVVALEKAQKEDEMWRELAAFSVYLSVGMALSIPQVLGIKLPNPTKAIEALFKPISELLK